MEVRTSFAVPHNEGEKVIAFDMDYLVEMENLLSRNGTKEHVVGWSVAAFLLTFLLPFHDPHDWESNEASDKR